MIPILVVIAVLVLFVAPVVLLGGWLTMLCLGALAHVFGVAALAVGFWPSVIVTIVIFVLFGK